MEGKNKWREGRVRTAALLVLPAGDSGNEVHFGCFDPLGLEPELIPEIQAEEERNREVVGDERGRVPVALEEDAPVGEQDDDDGPSQAPPSGVWGELAVPREVRGIDALSFQALPEPDTSETDAEPVEHS